MLRSESQAFLAVGKGDKRADLPWHERTCDWLPRACGLEAQTPWHVVASGPVRGMPPLLWSDAPDGRAAATAPAEPAGHEHREWCDGHRAAPTGAWLSLHRLRAGDAALLGMTHRIRAHRVAPGGWGATARLCVAVRIVSL